MEQERDAARTAQQQSEQALQDARLKQQQTEQALHESLASKSATKGSDDQVSRQNLHGGWA